MLSALRRYLLLPALIIYSGLLLFAATPDEIRPAAVAEVQKKVRRSFRDSNLRPYAFVFAGRRGRWKRRSVILTAHARLPGGELKRVFAAPAAPLTGFRLTRPAEETWALKSLVISPANKLMMTPGKAGRRTQILRLKNHWRIKKLSRFACHSTHAAAGAADRVYITVAYDTIDYKTGRIVDPVHVIQVYDCRRDRAVTRGLWPGARRDAQGMPEPTPGISDPVFGRRGVQRVRRSRTGKAGKKTRKRKRSKRRSRKRSRTRHERRLDAPRDRGAGQGLLDRMPSAKPIPTLEKPALNPKYLGPTRDALRQLETGEK